MSSSDLSNFQCGVIAVCFSYSFMDVLYIKPDSCAGEMQKWHLISYVLVVAFRLVVNIGMKYSHQGDFFLFSFRQKSKVAGASVFATWGFFVPFFTAWTILGSFWYYEAMMYSPRCQVGPRGLHPYLVLFWQFLCYIWAFIYGSYFVFACTIEYRLRKHRRNVRAVQTDEMRMWWGRSALDTFEESFSALEVAKKNLGLQAHEIQALPSVQVHHDKAVGRDMQCSICLGDFAHGDMIRQLPGCGHAFHQSCVDIWLLRRAECPLCKNNLCKPPVDIKPKGCCVFRKFRAASSAPLAEHEMP